MTPQQSAALTSMAADLAAATTALTPARTELVTAEYTLPRNDGTVRARTAAVFRA